MTELDGLIEPVRSSALRLLTRREHSKLELQRKLAAKDYPSELIETVIEDLATENWQSDERFAEAYARARIRKGYGPIRIQLELQQRGVDGSSLNAVADELCGGWEILIQSVYTKKYGDEGFDSPQQQSKCWRFLQQRGFTSEQIQALFKIIE